MAAEGRFAEITREKLADRIGCAPTLISYHWGLDALRDAVLRKGCETQEPHIVVAAVACNHAAAAKLSISARCDAIIAVTRCD
jgi:hypothetical protein